MRLVLILGLLALSACAKPETGLAVGPQVPPLPSQLSQKAGRLEPNSDATLAGQIRDNNKSIRSYNDVAHQNNKLIDLYNCVRESINNKKEPKCL